MVRWLLTEKMVTCAGNLIRYNRPDCGSGLLAAIIECRSTLPQMSIITNYLSVHVG